jgi:hypothetical protein
MGQSWSYTMQMPASGWQDPMFDASAWLQGLAPFGSRFEYPWAPRTGWGGPEIWLRRELTLASVPSSLDLRIFHNGPVEVYLNGNLAFEGNPSSIGYRVSPVAETARASLTAGNNTIAVHCRQNVDQAFGNFIDVGLGRLSWH